jgi:DNA repair protein RadA/Sms
MAGSPGSGKTTLLLALAHLLGARVLFASGEENGQQVGHAAARLGVTSEAIRFMASDSLAEILEEAALVKPRLLIINSINTTRSQDGRSGLRAAVDVMRQAVAWTESREAMTMFAGHITWKGHSAGPRDLEHDVGAVLYLKLDGSRRLLEVRKSRVGPSPQRLEVPDLSHLI